MVTLKFVYGRGIWVIKYTDLGRIHDVEIKFLELS
jgi:hypothetical protein